MAENWWKCFAFAVKLNSGFKFKCLWPRVEAVPVRLNNITKERQNSIKCHHQNWICRCVCLNVCCSLDCITCCGSPEGFRLQLNCVALENFGIVKIMFDSAVVAALNHFQKSFDIDDYFRIQIVASKVCSSALDGSWWSLPSSFLFWLDVRLNVRETSRVM